MENQTKTPKKLWKPPSFEDFNVESPSKRIKLDPHPIPKQTKQEEEFIQIDVPEPKVIQDLATHPKKIEEVKSWLENYQHKKGAMLLLSGPAGAAKTITLKVIAKSLNVTIREWINPVDKIEFQNESSLNKDPYDKFNFFESRQTDKFEDFIFRTSRYKSLFEEEADSILLIEDFPNIFIWKPNLFHKFLERYRENGKCPIVFVCTDDQNLNLENDLFPAHVKQKFNITNIKFNPVNHTSVMKILNRTLEKHSDIAVVSKETLESIAHDSNGDIRNALSGLQVLLIGVKPLRIKGASKIKKKKAAAELPKLNSVSIKDTNNDFYQTMGRILYPKRICDSVKKDEPVCENKNRIFVHDVWQITEHCSNAFFMLSHENYLLTFSKLHDIVRGSEYLSVCDGFDGHDEVKDYAKLIAVLGLMTANTQPKKGGFRPIKKSTWSSVRNDALEKRTRYSRFRTSSRVLNLDYLPYLKVLPQWRDLIDYKDSTRLSTTQSSRFLGSQSCASSSRSTQADDAEEEVIIEEVEDD